MWEKIIEIENLKTPLEIVEATREAAIDDDRWMNPKIIIDNETKEGIRQIIFLCNAEKYKEACDAIVTDEFIEHISKYSSTLIGGSFQRYYVNTFFDDYNIFVRVEEIRENGHSCCIVCIPQEGVGFIIKRIYGDYYDPNIDGILSDNCWGYLTCPAKDWRFNGAFYGYYYMDVEGYPADGYFYDGSSVAECEGVLVDDYYDGEILRKFTQDSGYESRMVYRYDNGKIIPYGEDDSGESIIIGQNESGGGNLVVMKEGYEEMYGRRKYGPTAPDIEEHIHIGYDEPWLPWE